MATLESVMNTLKEDDKEKENEETLKKPDEEIKEPEHEEHEHEEQEVKQPEVKEHEEQEVKQPEEQEVKEQEIKQPVKHTKEEKEKYAWEKTNQELKELREENRKFQEQMAKLTAKPKEVPKKYKKEDFVDEESYFKYLANESLKERLNQAQIKKEELAQRNQETVKAKENFDAKVKEIFDSNSDAYYSVVDKALNDGMSNILDKNPDVMKYIADSPISPKLAFHFAVVPNDLIAIVKQQNPQARLVKLASLEEKLSQITMFNQPLKKSVSTSKKEIDIGRLGNEQSTASSDLSDEEALKIVDDLKRRRY
jgi:myosin heavy subunit